MENRISKLKIDFNNITSIRNNVKSVFDILQLNPDLGDDFYRVLINWLDNNDIEVIED